MRGALPPPLPCAPWCASGLKMHGNGSRLQGSWDALAFMSALHGSPPAAPAGPAAGPWRQSCPSRHSSPARRSPGPQRTGGRPLPAGLEAARLPQKRPRLRARGRVQVQREPAGPERARRPGRAAHCGVPVHTEPGNGGIAPGTPCGAPCAALCSGPLEPPRSSRVQFPWMRSPQFRMDCALSALIAPRIPPTGRPTGQRLSPPPTPTWSAAAR